MDDSFDHCSTMVVLNVLSAFRCAEASIRAFGLQWRADAATDRRGRSATVHGAPIPSSFLQCPILGVLQHKTCVTLAGIPSLHSVIFSGCIFPARKHDRNCWLSTLNFRRESRQQEFPSKRSHTFVPKRSRWSRAAPTHPQELFRIPPPAHCRGKWTYVQDVRRGGLFRRRGRPEVRWAELDL
jgi:hypothetical protein